MNAPEVRYAKAGDIYIAYQVVGEGPIDLVFMPNWFSNLEVFWQSPRIENWFRRMAGFCRLILFDQRGTGLSDPVAIQDLILLEERSRDVLAVLDAVGVERAAIFAATLATPLACFFAAAHSSRTASLVLLDGLYSPPEGAEAERVQAIIESVPEKWSTIDYGRDRMRELAEREFFAYYRRMSVAPGAAQGMFRATMTMDVRHLLPAIHVPTLVLVHTRNPSSPIEHSVLAAEQIPQARMVELETDGFSWGSSDQMEILDEVEEFLTGVRRGPEPDRVLATVLFTDVVASTERVANIGDRAWTHLLATHEALVRDHVDKFQGRVVDVRGEESLSMFDGPGRGIRCAHAIRDALSGMDVDIRAGLHTGEVELVGSQVAGMAVHIGARVAALAGPGEVLVSTTVKDLVIGSGIEFEDRGPHELKGVPGEWRIYAVA
ncbi:MAG TPA: adenylate/guanylate cyclase domain-containing protein [Actinomycetota bacterium]|nr:adenylate/guanylate cyclase domain-containing protein [Actinomycetota bacterium]